MLHITWIPEHAQTLLSVAMLHIVSMISASASQDQQAQAQCSCSTLPQLCLGTAAAWASPWPADMVPTGGMNNAVEAKVCGSGPVPMAGITVMMKFQFLRTLSQAMQDLKLQDSQRPDLRQLFVQREPEGREITTNLNPPHLLLLSQGLLQVKNLPPELSHFSIELDNLVLLRRQLLMEV